MPEVEQAIVSQRTNVTDAGVRIALVDTPKHGLPIQVAEGTWWIRLPLSSALDHVNVYAIEDDQGWTLIDTGSNTEACRAGLDAVFVHGPLANKPIHRVVATHYHPDHIGLAGWLAERGARLYATQVCWLTARMMQLDNRTIPCEAQVQFAERAGVKGLALAAYRRLPPSSYPKLLTPIPFSYTRLDEGDEIEIGHRRWRVCIDNGHAAGHATLWSDDGLALTGDQILPGIVSNLSVHASEPDADLVSEWLESCRRLSFVATDTTLCLPGHNAPFLGAPARCEQIISNLELVLQRLLQRLARPATAVECLDTVYRRALGTNEQAALISETVGFLNHLSAQGLIRRELNRDGAYLWRLSPSSSPRQLAPTQKSRTS